MSSIIKITSVIIGTIIGAGFISGQEIYSFFNKYGEYGQIGILVATLIITIVIFKTCKLIKEKNIKNHEELLKYTIRNKIIIYTIKNIINIFLAISFFIMCSAFSTYCLENYNIPKIIGGVIISILSYTILKKDVKIIIKLNAILIPLLIIFIIIIGIIAMQWETNNLTKSENILIPIEKGILYANYNCIVLIPMILTLKKEITNKKQIKIISIISFIIILMLLEIIYISQGKIELDKSEMPMLEISKNISKNCIIIYGIMTGIAIFTSAIAAGHSLINNIKVKSIAKRRILLLISLIAIPISQLSFSTLVNQIYPIFGILGAIQIIFILKP